MLLLNPSLTRGVQNKKKFRNPDHSETVNGWIEDLKEYVPLPLVAEAKRLLEAEIRSAEGLNEPVFAGIGIGIGICVCVCVCVCLIKYCMFRSDLWT